MCVSKERVILNIYIYIYIYIYESPKWVFFRLKKGEGLVLQSGDDLIPFNQLSFFAN